jgi:hypothetical protein
MPLRTHHVFLLLASLGAAACTTLTVEERIGACQATDWATYGENDGRLGVAMAEREAKFTDCAALGYPADLAAYQAGRAEGLRAYCTLESGYEAGYAGRRYRNVCPPELEPAFRQGYEQGERERPAAYYYPYYYPYYGYGYGFGLGYYRYPYFGHYYGHRHRHGGRRGSQK